MGRLSGAGAMSGPGAMPGAATISQGHDEAAQFADSVAGVLDRLAPPPPAWRPGHIPDDEERATVAAALDELGWSMLAHEPQLAAFAGLAGVQLGRRLAAPDLVDSLLGGAPVAGGLARSLDVADERRPRPTVLTAGPLGPERRVAGSWEAVPYAEGLRVHRVAELGEPERLDPVAVGVARDAWLAASVGYLAGLAAGAVDLTVAHARARRAFGATLADLAPVQQLLAGAATAARGLELLAAEGASCEALAHAGEAASAACAACQQATGALGFTLEHPLHRYAQRARALAIFNDALLDTLLP